MALCMSPASVVCAPWNGEAMPGYTFTTMWLWTPGPVPMDAAPMMDGQVIAPSAGPDEVNEDKSNTDPASGFLPFNSDHLKTNFQDPGVHGGWLSEVPTDCGASQGQDSLCSIVTDEEWRTVSGAGAQDQYFNPELNRFMYGRKHCDVPKRLDFSAGPRPDSKSEEVHTLMIRNVPNWFSRWNLMQEFTRCGFNGDYDFMYLPFDTYTAMNVGYAFVNFEDPARAAAFREVFHGREFPTRSSRKGRLAQVSVAHLQGLKANLAHCHSTSLSFSVPPWQRPWVKEQQRLYAKQTDEKDGEPNWHL